MNAIIGNSAGLLSAIYTPFNFKPPIQTLRHEQERTARRVLNRCCCQLTLPSIPRNERDVMLDALLSAAGTTAIRSLIRINVVGSLIFFFLCVSLYCRRFMRSLGNCNVANLRWVVDGLSGCFCPISLEY